MAHVEPTPGDGREALIRELHDIALNRLSSVSLQLMAAEADPAGAASALRRVDALTREATHSLRMVERLLQSPEAPVPHLRAATVQLPTHLVQRRTVELRRRGVDLRTSVPSAADELDLVTRNATVLVLTTLTDYLVARAASGARATVEAGVDEASVAIVLHSHPLPGVAPTPAPEGETTGPLLDCVTRSGGTLEVDARPEAGTWRVEVTLSRPT